MAAFADLVLADSVPANRTFAPFAIDSNGVARWFEANSIMDARLGLTGSITLPSKGGNVARVRYKLNIPVMDTVVTTLKVGDVICNVEYIIPKRASATNRTDIRSLSYNLLNSAPLQNAVNSLASVY